MTEPPPYCVCNGRSIPDPQLETYKNTLLSVAYMNRTPLEQIPAWVVDQRKRPVIHPLRYMSTSFTCWNAKSSCAAGDLLCIRLNGLAANVFTCQRSESETWKNAASPIFWSSRICDLLWRLIMTHLRSYSIRVSLKLRRVEKGHSALNPPLP